MNVLKLKNWTLCLYDLEHTRKEPIENGTQMAKTCQALILKRLRFVCVYTYKFEISTSLLVWKTYLNHCAILTAIPQSLGWKNTYVYLV
jgi:hypothetical protein